MKKLLIGTGFTLLFFTLLLNAAELTPGLNSAGTVPLGMTNDQINLLYKDALGLYKEGQYLKAVDTLEDALSLLKSEYISNIRQALNIQPDEAAIRELLRKSKQKLMLKQELLNPQTGQGKFDPLPEEYNTKRNLMMEDTLMLAEEILIQAKEGELRQLSQLKVTEEGRLKIKKDELTRRKQELKTKIYEMKRDLAQERALVEIMVIAQQEEEAKVKKIEVLWQRARKLYAQGRYDEAIRDFQEIVELEGNPRIKYTPYAKEYIDKAKDKILEQKKSALSKDVERAENNMVNKVLEQQIPPYIEPLVSTERVEVTPLIEPPAIRKKLKTKEISLDFDKVDLKSALSFLSQESGINFIASQKVLDLALKVTARFNEMPADEVIKYLTKSLGLIYRIDKDTVWVAHPDEIANEATETRVYYLTKGGGLFTEFTPISSSSETALGGSSAQISKITTIEDTLKEVIPWPADAKLTYDKRLNALIVRNTPQNLQMLEDLLYSLDVTPYQILIEARFMEVTLTDTEELGLELKTNSAAALSKSEGSFRHGLAQDAGIDFTAFANAASGANLTYQGVLTRPQFQAVLHAYLKNQRAKTLSSPRITTLNNQMATIKVVDEWIYPTRYEYETVQTDTNGDGDFNDAGETTYKNVPKDFLRRDVGILLKVMPSVGADRKTISLALIPEVSEGTASGFSYSGDVTLPKFTSRNLSTTVVVNSGDTVVLGGLMKESRTKTITKVPFLGEIPILGALFTKREDSIERKNLLIFVTAKVMSPSGEEVVVASK
ncbi:MAG: tetratricopeptide repeat protein [Candidatus Omnitrophica bacterium]|nr:tetratricopeptide repeat protein [Candidatus Omnitrophota bacterium]